MPRKKAVKKSAPKKPVKRNRPAAKKEPAEAKKVLTLDFESEVGTQFVDFLHKNDPKSVFRLDNETEEYLGVKRGFYSGLPTLDRALAVKANSNYFLHPYGKIMEVYGPEGGGKTTYMNYLAAKMISIGGIVMFLDWEHKWDPTWLYRTAQMNFGLTEEQVKARLLPVDPKHVQWFNSWIIKTMKTIIQSKLNAEETLRKLQSAKKKPANYKDIEAACAQTMKLPFLIINDSIAGMYTEAEVKGEEESVAQVAELAREFSRKLKMIRRYLKFTNMLMIFTNQERDVIGGTGYSKIKTPGGNAVKHFCDARIRIARMGMLERTRNGIKNYYGSEHIFTMKKNQLGVPPFKKVVLRLLYDRGYFTFHSLLEASHAVGLVQKVGSRYVVNSGKHVLNFEESKTDEALASVEAQFPHFEATLHEIYQNVMSAPR